MDLQCTQPLAGMKAKLPLFWATSQSHCLTHVPLEISLGKMGGGGVGVALWED